MVRIKICGLRTRDEAEAAVRLGAHAVGFVFAPSPRRINPEQAREIIRGLPPFVTRVGVFVNEPRYSVQEIATFCQLDALQFHGQEPPEYLRGFSQQLIKAFPVASREVLADMEGYKGLASAFLLDAFVPGQSGGTGQTFNWEIAREVVTAGIRVILAGGLTPENVAKAIAMVKPYAVDVSSGVETDGVKDEAKMVQFIREAIRFGC